MQKRTKPLTVMLEPALYELMQEAHQDIGLSLWAHDILLNQLMKEGIVTPQSYMNKLIEHGSLNDNTTSQSTPATIAPATA